jgi:hypothetical protein
MCVQFRWLMLTMLRNPTLVWWSSDTSIVHRLCNWDRSSYIYDISNPDAKYGIYDILFLFRSFKHLMVVFLWAINGHLLLDPTLVWWRNDVLINHTELTIEVCLTVWNWCIRVHDGTRVVLSKSYVIRVVTAQELCFKAEPQSRWPGSGPSANSA